jgi:glutamate-1-semialdehyde 2,1-aminomutase
MNNTDVMTRAAKLMPAGVNSPVRAFRAVGGQPKVIERASGARIFDVEGTPYLDYVGSWGPAILGHANPQVIEAVQAAATRGLSFGAPTAQEVDFAESVIACYPTIEMLRCVSSGTEATMSALRLARGFTGRDLIVKFEGGYHGHSDGLLVKAGSGAATFGSPDSAGVPSAVAQTTVVLPYNNIAALEQCFASLPQAIAAVIVEPVAGNMGCVPPAPGFLDAIVELCARYGAISIFDEVMTGCRVAKGGAQARYAQRPALTCLGKIVGGGMPLAVYGGRRDIMEKISPLGPVYQAGTLSGSPLAVAAGIATLAQLNSELYDRLEQLGARLEQGLNAALAATQTEGCVQRVGSMITLFFAKGPIRSWDDAKGCDTARFGRWHRAMTEGGIYWPPAQFEAAFISGAHTTADIDQTVKTAEAALKASRADSVRAAT